MGNGAYTEFSGEGRVSPDRQLSQQAKQRSDVEGEHLELAARVYLSLDSH